ncbi:alpha/beta fold hydrolase [Lolliginicoccus suaedae]|uniref:alpha/beta fold hydrolase n=1 Tax=Lolliginicoccus suaedae TaxID=2605429 RepID=UPI0011F042D0|nr:alpha/beta hydrolase [Lolliginicoccus suaedae]
MTEGITQPGRAIVQGAGRDLVILVHGFSDSADGWHRVQPILARGRTVVAIDLPGFGQSHEAWPLPLLETYRDLILAVAREHGRGGTTTIVGNSLGGVAAAHAAAHAPDLIDRIVLADVPGLAPTPPLWARASSDRAEAILRALTRRLPAPAAITVFELVFSAAARHRKRLDIAARRAVRENYPHPSTVVALLPKARDVLRAIDELDLPGLIADLSMPVHLVWGERDWLTPPRTGRHLLAHPHVSSAVLPGCGHCPQHDRPRAFATYLEAVLGAPRDAVGQDTTERKEIVP